MAAWSRNVKTLKKFQFFACFGENDPFRKIFQNSVPKDSSRHRSTCCVQISWNLADGKSVKPCVIYLRKKTKICLAVQLSLLRKSRPKCQASSRQCAHYPECSRFHPNRFTFGGFTSEHVNTVRARSKVNPIFGWSLASSRIMTNLHLRYMCP